VQLDNADSVTDRLQRNPVRVGWPVNGESWRIASDRISRLPVKRKVLTHAHSDDTQVDSFVDGDCHWSGKVVELPTRKADKFEARGRRASRAQAYGDTQRQKCGALSVHSCTSSNVWFVVYNDDSYPHLVPSDRDDQVGVAKLDRTDLEDEESSCHSDKLGRDYFGRCYAPFRLGLGGSVIFPLVANGEGVVWWALKHPVLFAHDKVVGGG